VNPNTAAGAAAAEVASAAAVRVIFAPDVPATAEVLSRVIFAFENVTPSAASIETVVLSSATVELVGFVVTVAINVPLAMSAAVPACAALIGSFTADPALGVVVIAVPFVNVKVVALAAANEGTAATIPKPNAATVTSEIRLNVVFLDICFLSIVELRTIRISALGGNEHLISKERVKMAQEEGICM
jgi:hypothetical protein